MGHDRLRGYRYLRASTLCGDPGAWRALRIECRIKRLHGGVGRLAKAGHAGLKVIAQQGAPLVPVRRKRRTIQDGRATGEGGCFNDRHAGKVGVPIGRVPRPNPDELSSPLPPRMIEAGFVSGRSFFNGLLAPRTHTSQTTPMHPLLRLIQRIDSLNRRIYSATCWLTLVKVLIGAFNALERYGDRFLPVRMSSNGWIELQWYFFSLVFLAAAPHALRLESHVRVDVFYGRLSIRGKAWIDAVGGVLLLIPFCIYAVVVTYPTAMESLRVREVSPDPGGLARWPLKLIVPVAFVLLALQGVANAMRAMGLKPGDSAGVFIPLVPEAVIVMYACFKTGIAVLPVFSGFGPEGLAERLAHAGAKILFTVDGAVRRGKTIPLKTTADEALKRKTSIEKVVVVQRSGIDVPMKKGRDETWKEFTAGHPDRAMTARLPADAVSMIMYTSGTTGKPKGTIYTHAGLMTGPGREMRYCFDLREGDLMYWVTDFGWVMAPYELVGSHFSGRSSVWCAVSTRLS